MGKKNIINVANEIYKQLEPFTPDERGRVISAVMSLFGQEEMTLSGTGSVETNAQKYFNLKDPCTKEEILAVAARFREQNQGQHKHKKGDFKSIIETEARRNFDDHNFSWDIRNAKKKGLFIADKEIRLSYYGQQYVDALPNREALKKLRPPTKRRKKKAKAKVKKA